MKNFLAKIRPAIAPSFGLLVIGYMPAAMAELPTVGVVENLINGDRACYVDLLTDDGAVETQFASFDICAEDIVGKRVQLSYESSEIQAAACEGDPDCGLSETVMLITDATVLSNSSTITSEPLPLLTAAELTELEEGLEIGKENWFGLAGLNKVIAPPQLTEAIKTYRESWQKVDPAIAPFLGTWHDDEYEQNRYSLSIFPTQSPSEVCVLEFKPEWSMSLWNEATQNYSNKDVISEGIYSFSFATIEAGQLRSPNIRTAESAITTLTYDFTTNHDVVLMGALDKQGNFHTVAIADEPTFPQNLPLSDSLAEEMRLAVSEYGCSLP